jgi:hypothetical protein
VLPPSSETGRTWATRVVNFFSSSTTPLNAVPPESNSKTQDNKALKRNRKNMNMMKLEMLDNRYGK